ncbi:MAG TPA: type II toxin-antitoxin system VapC family toxin [Terracidiphilus sp.]|nr:type II toxin-antitoxin system VapC family toxin [Terracidiphilus sp.]
MIVLDVNLLLYAYDTASLEHRKARKWVEEVFSGDEPIGLPWQTLTAFIRILTYPGLLGERFTRGQALAIVDQWVEMPHVRTLTPGERHWTLFRDMLVNGNVRGKVTTDAALAALTIEYGGVLHTNDRDFARFPGLRWVNPLV